jgi:hypothetical protein
MNDSREHDGWLDPALAEQLLRGDYTDAARADARAAALARLLMVAAEPHPAASRHHERAAMAAFRETWGVREEGAAPGRPSRAPAGGRGRDLPRRARRTWGTRRPTKAALCGAVAVFALGGVAIAAQTGTLPGPFQDRPGATSSPRVSPGGSAPDTTGGSPAAGRPPGGTRSPAGSAASPSAPPTAAEAEHLCDEYAKAEVRRKPLDPATRTRLEQAAGGMPAVAPFCARVTAGATPAPSVEPTRTPVTTSTPHTQPPSPTANPSPAARATPAPTPTRAVATAPTDLMATTGSVTGSVTSSGGRPDR